MTLWLTGDYDRSSLLLQGISSVSECPVPASWAVFLLPPRPGASASEGQGAARGGRRDDSREMRRSDEDWWPREDNSHKNRGWINCVTNSAADDPSVSQSRKRPGPSPGWKRLLVLSHLTLYCRWVDISTWTPHPQDCLYLRLSPSVLDNSFFADSLWTCYNFLASLQIIFNWENAQSKFLDNFLSII